MFLSLGSLFKQGTSRACMPRYTTENAQGGTLFTYRPQELKYNNALNAMQVQTSTWASTKKVNVPVRGNVGAPTSMPTTSMLAPVSHQNFVLISWSTRGYSAQWKKPSTLGEQNTSHNSAAPCSSMSTSMRAGEGGCKAWLLKAKMGMLQLHTNQKMHAVDPLSAKNAHALSTTSPPTTTQQRFKQTHKQEQQLRAH
mmetsp:Transcript_14068/g.38019  ORF Transcript_14068/g.38019 Transcript_14068/m.38019 type:complete len:197 (-) Transcript_14068:1436-2026(-)|eukprot:scaffold136241_cov15-Tisochrysis_lutea.AAC.1